MSKIHFSPIPWLQVRVAISFSAFKSLDFFCRKTYFVGKKCWNQHFTTQYLPSIKLHIFMSVFAKCLNGLNLCILTWKCNFYCSSWHELPLASVQHRHKLTVKNGFDPCMNVWKDQKLITAVNKKKKKVWPKKLQQLP